jgi:putative nucleotidyltransferase with HDIG domain
MSMNDVRNVLETRCPGLHGRIEQMLIDAEARYSRRTNQPASEFLLEHTQRTAAIALKISSIEGVDSFLPVLVALYHDAGKFYDGDYHKDDIAEEEHAVVLANSMLAEFGIDRSDIDAVRQALRALYNDKLPCVGASRIVQDADRLDKLGALGVSAFFTKAALRGRGLIDALMQAASRELTYALAAPRSMFTEAGKTLARKQAAKTVAFFEGLLDDLESWGIASFERRTILLQEDFRTRDGATVPNMEVTIVMPRSCPVCDASLELTHRRGRGIKCEKLTARFGCDDCDYAAETSFCLPVLA